MTTLLASTALPLGCAGTRQTKESPAVASLDKGFLEQPVIFERGRITTANGITFDREGRRLWVSRFVPSVSPDGRYFFYSGGGGVVRQISLRRVLNP